MVLFVNVVLWFRFLKVLTNCVYVCVLQVLCCVEKQGILSWPSPNPEKILFFSKSASSQETDRQRQKEAKREKEKDMEEVGLKDPIQVKKINKSK